ncbi:MAG: hypothetical protein M3Y74_12950 [Chloroflexota bacterium]|nr:hypothetical protein [Chloroflexota bacterium]
MMEITVQVPDALGQRLRRYQERLPEVLERGLREVMAEGSGAFQDESGVLEVLASEPAPDQILALHPSAQLQARVADLLDAGKRSELSPADEAELERYLAVEHLVRLAKAHAYKRFVARG